MQNALYGTVTNTHLCGHKETGPIFVPRKLPLSFTHAHHMALHLAGGSLCLFTSNF